MALLASGASSIRQIQSFQIKVQARRLEKEEEAFVHKKQNASLQGMGCCVPQEGQAVGNTGRFKPP